MESFKRTDRVGELIKIKVSEILSEEVSDPRLGLLSVTKVVVSSDLKHAFIYVSSLKDEDETAVKGCLDHARGFIQKRLASRIKLRFTPIIEFRIDNSIKQSIHIMEILEELKKEKHTNEE